MIKINPQVLYDDNKNAVGVFLSKEDYNKVINEMEDLEDSLIMSKAKEESGPHYTEEEAYKIMGFSEKDIKEIKENTVKNPLENKGVEEKEKEVEYCLN